MLIVEDEESVVALLELQMTGLHASMCDFLEARDGHQALALARSAFPNLVITDLMMPGMDGLELIQTLRTEPDERLRNVPIIVVTQAPQEYHWTAYEAGANLVLQKPVMRRELVDAIHKLVVPRKST